MSAIEDARTAAQGFIDQSESDISLAAHRRSSLYRQAADQFAAAGDEERREDMGREMLAFDLSTGQREDRYFGSKGSGTLENGEPFEYPDWTTGFPDETLDYYERRVTETTNPTLLARYYDLLWERRRNHLHGRAASKAYIDACPTYYADDQLIELGAALERGLDLATRFNDQTLIPAAVTCHHDLINQMIADRRFRPLLELADSACARAPRLRANGVNLTALEAALVLAIQDYVDNDTDNFLIRRAFMDRLVKTRKLLGDEAGVRAARIDIADTFVEEAVAKGGQGNNMVAGHCYNEALDAYLDLGGFPEKVEELKLKIEAANAEAAKTEYQTISVPVEIPREVINEHFDRLYKGRTTAEICALMSLDPNLRTSWDEAVNFHQKHAQDFVFRMLFGTKVMQGNMVIKNVETDAEKEVYYTTEHFQQSYRLMAGMFLGPLFELIKAEDPDYVANLAEYLGETGTINAGRIALIRHGLRAFDQGEYVAALHILVFQVEGLLRDMVGAVGLPTFSYQRGPQEMRARLLTDLIETLGQLGMDGDLLKFIDVLLNNIMGENLRNNIAHALMPEGAFARQYVQMVLLILIRIAAYTTNAPAAAATTPEAAETTEAETVAEPETVPTAD